MTITLIGDGFNMRKTDQDTNEDCDTGNKYHDWLALYNLVKLHSRKEKSVLTPSSENGE